MSRLPLLSKKFLSGFGIVSIFGIFSALLILLHLGKILNFAYPLLGTITGFLVLKTRRDVYIAFVWWIFLFTPEVRRFVDYQTFYHNLSPVMLTPYLVCALAVVEIIKRPSFLRRREMLPFLLIILVALYAFIVGYITNGLSAVFDLADFMTPLLVGLLILSPDAKISQMLDAFVFSTQLGLVVIAAYGLYQYFDFPPWDAYWLQASHFTSAGSGLSEEVRLWGTLNSPGPYAYALMVSLVMSIVAKGPLRLLGAGFGFPAFGLSLVRSAWGAWLIALVFIIMRIGGKTRFRLVVFASLVIAIGIPVIMIGPVAVALSARLSTINNIQHDGSFQAREALYKSATENSFSNPIGVGFGRFGNSRKLTTGQSVSFDSGLLQIPDEFGWVGGSILVFCVISILRKTLNEAFTSRNPVIVAAVGLMIANLSQEIFGFTLSGLGGLSFWLPAGLVLSSQFARHKDQKLHRSSVGGMLP